MASSTRINMIECKIRDMVKERTLWVKGFHLTLNYEAVGEFGPSNFEAYLWFGWPAPAASCGSWFPWHRCAAPLETSSFEYSAWSRRAADFARGQSLGTNENIERSRWVRGGFDGFDWSFALVFVMFVVCLMSTCGCFGFLFLLDSCRWVVNFA